jgi:hypothetical protein
MDIEQRLRESLAAREPAADFEDAVMARLRLARPDAADTHAASRPRRPVWRWTAALAATVMAAAFGLHWHAEQQRAAYNHEQLLLALAITSYELDQVQQKLVRTEETGEEENGT